MDARATGFSAEPTLRPQPHARAPTWAPLEWGLGLGQQSEITARGRPAGQRAELGWERGPTVAGGSPRPLPQVIEEGEAMSPAHPHPRGEASQSPQGARAVCRAPRAPSPCTPTHRGPLWPCGTPAQDSSLRDPRPSARDRLPLLLQLGHLHVEASQRCGVRRLGGLGEEWVWPWAMGAQSHTSPSLPSWL